MPFVEVDTSVGRIKFSYVITTPSSISAEKLSPNFPTIVFLHSICPTKETFERQFDDPRLRQFNLVTLDFRGAGETAGAMNPKSYSPSETARDVYNIFQALKFPACHLFGVAGGSTVALELASNHPQLVLSLTLCSPLSPTELDDVAYGRRQICEYWHEYNRGLLAGKPSVDETLMDDVVTGAVQLMFNNKGTPLALAMTKIIHTYALKNWCQSPQQLIDYESACVSWFLNRKPMTGEQYKEIQCPVSIIHCKEDVAYPFQVARDLQSNLQSAGVKIVSLYQVPGPHLGCLTHPERFSKLTMNTIHAPFSNHIDQNKHDSLRNYIIYTTSKPQIAVQTRNTGPQIGNPILP
ncbi:hypothetical protein AMATHDRAFT_67041 [Amanita thiersii Skay4041]|uniref:AB hydrolase-1 domain-containing protein n=1 Tax=Amanita thiersii Skay4041 TaxID=703135 RepID=A0A2A9NJ22_9AGAR|nr:hypothetical protein AMATHDRAFT_67041 [Amanita thiersii Skay4041]